MPIDYTNGDATLPVGDGNKIITHICNDLGGWGKGFVVAISRRWPEPERAYRQWYRERNDNDFALGAVQLVQVTDDTWVANLIGQRGIRASRSRPPIRYGAVEIGLRAVARHAETLAASVHMPRIGCGLAGGKWDEIGPLVEAACTHVPVTVYDFP